MTKQELIKKLGEIFQVQDYEWGTCDVRIEPEWDDGDLKIAMSQMYEYIDQERYSEPVSLFERLQSLAALFGTQKINVGERDFYSGCETCDHGSKYTVVYWVKKPTIEVEL